MMKSRMEFYQKHSSIENAIFLLEIDEKSFSRIHSVELKTSHLLYKFLRQEQIIIEQFFQNTFTAQDKEVFFLFLEKAHIQLLQSHYFTQHKTSYSKYSFGLQEIDMRSVHSNHASMQANFLNALSVIEMKSKESGVEPGFEGVQIESILLAIYQYFPKSQQRREFLSTYRGDIINNMEEVARRVDIPKFLIKGAYKEENKSGNTLYPSENNLKGTNAVQSRTNPLSRWIFLKAYAFYKQSTVVDENWKFLAEVFGNNLANVYGMPTQYQTVLCGEYADGLMQLMAKGLWVNNVSMLGPLAGSVDNNNYMVKKVVKPHSNVLYLSDNSIAKLGHHFVTMLLLADPDGIGSKGQNKLQYLNELFGIDFGHLFEEKILARIANDFRFSFGAFKNYSVFYDKPRSDYVVGLLRLAKMAGMEISKEVLTSYSSEIQKELDSVLPGLDVILCEEYARKFEEMADLYKHNPSAKSRENQQMCLAFAAKFYQLKKDLIEVRDELINKFKPYLSSPKEYIDFVENIERIIAGKDGVTLFSPDGTVLLNHIRVLERPEMIWSFQQISGTNEMDVTAEFKDVVALQKAHEALMCWPAAENLKLSISRDAKQLRITVNRTKENELFSLFSEDVIKSVYMPREFVLQEAYQNDIKLQVVLSQFSTFGILGELKNGVEETYEINLQAEKGFDAEWSKMIEEKFKIKKQENKYLISFILGEGARILDLLQSLPESVDNYRLMLKVVALHTINLNQILLDFKKLYGIDMPLSFREQDGRFIFNINPNQCVDFALILKNKFGENQIEMDHSNVGNIFPLIQSAMQDYQSYLDEKKKAEQLKAENERQRKLLQDTKDKTKKLEEELKTVREQNKFFTGNVIALVGQQEEIRNLSNKQIEQLMLDLQEKRIQLAQQNYQNARDNFISKIKKLRTSLGNPTTLVGSFFSHIPMVGSSIYSKATQVTNPDSAASLVSFLNEFIEKDNFSENALKVNLFTKLNARYEFIKSYACYKEQVDIIGEVKKTAEELLAQAQEYGKLIQYSVTKGSAAATVIAPPKM